MKPWCNCSNSMHDSAQHLGAHPMQCPFSHSSHPQSSLHSKRSLHSYITVRPIQSTLSAQSTHPMQPLTAGHNILVHSFTSQCCPQQRQQPHMPAMLVMVTTAAEGAAAAAAYRSCNRSQSIMCADTFTFW